MSARRARRSEPAPGARHPRWAPSWARAVLAGLLLTVAGCLPGMRRPHPLPPATATGLLEELAARRAAVQSLRARVRLRAGLAGMWVREVLLVRRPSSVRIDVLSPFGLALAVGTDGGLLWAYPAGQGTRYEGAATPANLARFLGTPATVADVVDVLLGTAPRRTPAGPSTLRATSRGEYELVVPLADGAQRLRFAGDPLRLIAADETHRDGAALHVTFADFRDGFPHALELASAEKSARASVVYDAAEPNAAVDAALFAPPPASHVVPLDTAGPRP